MSETNHDWDRIMNGAKHGKNSNFNACAAEGTADTATTDAAEDDSASSGDVGWGAAMDKVNKQNKGGF